MCRPPGRLDLFVEEYPYEVEIVDGHFTCKHANNASHSTWRAKILDGSMFDSAKEITWGLSLGNRAGQ